MNERMDDYLRLFPVHPDYIEVFDRVRFAEKRGALQTLSQAMGRLVDKDVPKDGQAWLRSTFWEEIRNNPVLRSDQDIREVIDVSQTLEDRIRHGMKPVYKAMAERIIHALSVHRLTTGGDTHVPVGLMATELRDGLCLYHPGIEELGGDPADDLLTQVQTVLREVLKTVNGQSISKAADTEQYYLDLKKNVDYDAQIEKKIATLDEEKLDRAYYSAVRQLMECSDTTYVTGHQIWQHRLEWVEHKVERNGYLFFGAPNDRPTAQPDRDFYLYFFQPFDPPKFKKQDLPDEVFLKLAGRDAAITSIIERFAAALDLGSTSSGQAKAIYQDKAASAPGDMAKWLRDKQLTAYEVTYQGKSKTLQDSLKGVNLRERAHIDANSTVAFRDVVNVVTGLCLAPHFANLAPEYPKFSVLITETNRRPAVQSALRALAGARGPATPRPRSTHWKRWTATASTRPSRATPSHSWHGSPPRAMGRSSTGLSCSPALQASSTTTMARHGWSRTGCSPGLRAWCTPATSCSLSPATRSTPAGSIYWWIAPSISWSASSIWNGRRNSTSPSCGPCLRCASCRQAMPGWSARATKPRWWTCKPP